jgi:hypothetical protein
MANVKLYRDRTATTYLPSKEMLDKWKSDAKSHHCSISDYIFEMVEKARRNSDQPDSGPALAKEITEVKGRCLRLEEENNLLKISLDNAQTEIYKLRFGGFNSPDQSEAREYDRALVNLLRRGGTHTAREILATLGIDPRDSQAVKIVSVQLEELRRFGLVKETFNGWTWTS